MAAFLTDSSLDAALNYIKTNATVLHICSSQPANYAGVAAVSLGTKTSPTIGSPVDGTSGRKVVVSAITDGSVSATGTASHYAIVSGTELLAANTLSASQSVTNGNVFTLATFDITLPDPTA